MQFSFNGFPKCGPTYNTSLPINGIPDIIGEGHVTSILSPDGSVQYLFFPTAHWWRPQSFNQIQNNGWNDIGAWFVRGIYNQMPSTLYSPYQPPCGLPLPMPMAPNMYSIEQIPPANNYQVKFHSDCCTSTSDIHYFYPNLRPHCWYQTPKSSIGIQVEVPKTSSSCQHQVTHDNKPCSCAPEKDKKQEVECMCYSTNSDSNSKMSISKSDVDCQKRKEKCKKKKLIKIKHKKKCNDVVICDCREAQSDKCVTTCAEQAVNTKEEGRQTQTTCDTGTLHRINTEPRKKNVNSEIWIPRTPRAKKLLVITSAQKVPGTCESATSDCGSNICSCCNSDSTGYTE